MGPVFFWPHIYIYIIYTSIHLIFEKKTFCQIPAMYIVFSGGSVRSCFTAFRRAQATSSQVKMENGVAHPQIEALWMGGQNVSCHPENFSWSPKNMFLLFWSVFGQNFPSLWGVFSIFYFWVLFCLPSRRRIIPLPGSPEAVCFPESLSFAHVPIFTFSLDVSVQVKSTWISIWCALCFVQSVQACFTLSFLVRSGTITRSLHFDLGEDDLLEAC